VLAHLRSGSEIAGVVRSHDSYEVRDSAVGKAERPQPVDADYISVRIEHEANKLAGKRIERSNPAAAVISDQ
jgi:hypothetical protein